LRLVRAVSLLVALLCSPAGAVESFLLKEVENPFRLDARELGPGTIYFDDHKKDEISDNGTGLMRFEEWSRQREVEKAVLSLYPLYIEPTINISVHGLTKRHTEKLHMYVVEARFVLSRPPGSIDLTRYTRLEFLERVDPSIKHKLITRDEVIPLIDPENAHNRHPDRTWCEEATHSICIQSRYQLEGKLPIGVRLANKLEDTGKQIADYIEFQSELRLLPADQMEEDPALPKLTGLSTPVIGALEQSIFHVNQVMQFGKFLAIFQQHPTDPAKTVVAAYMALAVETDVLEKKKEYEGVPVLRYLVPSQVLMAKC